MDTISPAQVLTENWEVIYTRAPWSSRTKKPITARLSWPHHVSYAISGSGRTIDEARIDLALRMAFAIVDVTDPAEPDDVKLDPETLTFLARASRQAINKVRRLVATAAA